jgi:hypothetical protein
VRALAIAFADGGKHPDESFATGSCSTLTVAGERLAANAIASWTAGE